MRLGVDVSLTRLAPGGSVPPVQASSDPNVLAVHADGWRANYIAPQNL